MGSSVVVRIKYMTEKDLQKVYIHRSKFTSAVGLGRGRPVVYRVVVMWTAAGRGRGRGPARCGPCAVQGCAAAVAPALAVCGATLRACVS